jgi:hypothetical protein
VMRKTAIETITIVNNMSNNRRMKNLAIRMLLWLRLRLRSMLNLRMRLE